MSHVDHQEPADAAADALEAAVDQAIAACGNDARAAVRTLVVALGSYEHEVDKLRREVEALTAALSLGYARRGRGGRARPAGSAGRSAHDLS